MNLKRIITIAAALFALLPLQARAAMNISVDPLVVQMQTAPGATARADVTMSNDGDQTERLIIVPIDWTTRPDGSVAMEKVGSERRSITRYLSASTYQFVLRPGEQRIVHISLAVPESFNPSAASYWGGFFVRATLFNDKPNAFGPGATVLIYNDIGQPRRHLGIQTLRAINTPEGVRVVSRLRNDSNAYVRAGGTLSVEQGGRIITQTPVTIGAVFPGRFHTVNTLLPHLASGTYRVELSVDYGADTIEDGEATLRVP
jgi:hypothetical protein